jgi:hypothetical protein
MPLVGAVPRAPYGLEPTNFPFPALATMAGRAPLGGPREMALACFLVARVASAAAAGHEGLSREQRLERARGVKHWLGAATIPTAVRTALTRLSDATAAEDANAVRTALDSVITVTANQLDSGARLELGRLAQAIAAQGSS